MKFRQFAFALLLASQPFVSNMAHAVDKAVVTPTATEAPVANQNSAGKLNINTASAEQFMALKGIGKKKAEAIISWRTEHGGFTSVAQLAEVNGISERFVTEHQAELSLN